METNPLNMFFWKYDYGQKHQLHIVFVLIGFDSAFLNLLYCNLKHKYV